MAMADHSQEYTTRENEGYDISAFHTLFDLVATHGWTAVLSELAEIACVRGDDAVGTVLTVLAEGLGDTLHSGMGIPAEQETTTN